MCFRGRCTVVVLHDQVANDMRGIEKEPAYTIVENPTGQL